MPKPTTTEPFRPGAAQRAALFMAAVGVLWVVATWAGGAFGLSNRLRALFDLAALAGFGWALWMTYQVWRNRQTEKR